MTPETVRVILDLVAYYFCVQMSFSALVLVMGRVILNPYEAWVYENPQNLFQRVITFCMVAVLGVGPYLNKKFMKFSWIVRKILLLISISILCVVCVIIYYVIKNILEMIFL
ncbi:hypothetical protein QNK12_29945 [Neobacillus cucumis]|nr:hypothetical protein QNK12_29945 [Neobacillus cucumis]